MYHHVMDIYIYNIDIDLTAKILMLTRDFHPWPIRKSTDLGISGWIGETLDQRYPKISDPLVSLDQDECQSGSC